MNIKKGWKASVGEGEEGKKGVEGKTMREGTLNSREYASQTSGRRALLKATYEFQDK